ncbi:hypothetical protein K435DRAFT_716082 [Dendrothele bispora CBS 962.96]|uniref:DUF6534 domain-containing protein n=1 Tax=Dendrothele bispora (strain CBS 962.96) TaxID=1314807 RepID=A0A4S8MK00_DENBC|nr:hypothetical protein K435DRAFT_716082 [Dendrothele bispora CBS 962.96]
MSGIPPLSDTLAQGPDLGAVELAVVISSVLYGIAVIQTYNYYMAAFKNDKLALKLMVSLLCCLETGHSAALWIYLYRLTVIDFQDPSALPSYTWDLRISVILAAIICSIVQVFFSYRVFLLSQIPYYFGLYSSLSLVRLGFSLTLASQPITDITILVSEFRWLVISGTALGAFVDFSNTTALCIFLKTKQQSITSTNQLINRLILWTIETGLLTSICDVLQLITVICLKGKVVWIFFFIQSAKLYANVVLASLNGRISLRTAQAKSHILPSSLGPRGGTRSDSNQLEVRIEMSVDREVVRAESPSVGEMTLKIKDSESGLNHPVLE